MPIITETLQAAADRGALNVAMLTQAAKEEAEEYQWGGLSTPSPKTLAFITEDPEAFAAASGNHAEFLRYIRTVEGAFKFEARDRVLRHPQVFNAITDTDDRLMVIAEYVCANDERRWIEHFFEQGFLPQETIYELTMLWLQSPVSNTTGGCVKDRRARNMMSQRYNEHWEYFSYEQMLAIFHECAIRFPVALLAAARSVWQYLGAHQFGPHDQRSQDVILTERLGCESVESLVLFHHVTQHLTDIKGSPGHRVEALHNARALPWELRVVVAEQLLKSGTDLSWVFGMMALDEDRNAVETMLAQILAMTSAKNVVSIYQMGVIAALNAGHPHDNAETKMQECWYMRRLQQRLLDLGWIRRFPTLHRPPRGRAKWQVTLPGGRDIVVHDDPSHRGAVVGEYKTVIVPLDPRALRLQRRQISGGRTLWYMCMHVEGKTPRRW